LHILLRRDGITINRKKTQRLLHPRSCATTPVGLWLPLDERQGSRQPQQANIRACNQLE